MQTSKKIPTKQNRSLNDGKAPVAPKATTPTPTTKESFTPLGDAIRQSGEYGEMLVENIEGLTYYQKAKTLISELFFNSMAINTPGEMSDEYKQLHLELHSGIQGLLDSIHREYVNGIREKNTRIYEEIVAMKLTTENVATA